MISITCGSIEGGHVGTALAAARDMLAGDEVVIVRGLDSVRDARELSRVLKQFKMPHAIEAGNVCCSINDLVPEYAEVFTGFDEVWIAQRRPRMDLSSIPRATSDSEDFKGGVHPEIEKAMVREHCLLLLADGCGLNYATSIEDLGQRLCDFFQ